MEKNPKIAIGEVRRAEMTNTSLDTEGSTPPVPVDEPEFLQNMSISEREKFEKKLLRRIDLRLMPMTVLMYIMNYLDRNNIASARIAGAEGKGLQDELNLTSTQYQVSTLGSEEGF
jgi:hypothetical protein